MLAVVDEDRRGGAVDPGFEPILDEGLMPQKLLRRSLVLASFLALSGCAQDSARPSYIGLTDLTPGNDDPSVAAPSQIPSESTRYVQSNKVLGAMAFHRVTGRTVDPDSLQRP